MPRKDVPLTVHEHRFVLHYLREGAAPEVVHIAERKARLKKGEGAHMLRRRHVQEEIHRRKILVEYEENRLIAKDNVAVVQRDDERDLVTLHKIEQALDKVLQLEAKDHGPTVLKAIELGLVYTGAIRDGNKVKLNVVDPLGQDKAKPDDGDQHVRELGFYQSIFSGVKPSAEGQAAQAQVEPAPLMPEDDKPKPPPTIPAPPSAPQKPTAKAKPRVEKPAPDIEIT